MGYAPSPRAFDACLRSSAKMSSSEAPSACMLSTRSRGTSASGVPAILSSAVVKRLCSGSIGGAAEAGPPSTAPRPNSSVLRVTNCCKKFKSSFLSIAARISGVSSPRSSSHFEIKLGVLCVTPSSLIKEVTSTSFGICLQRSCSSLRPAVYCPSNNVNILSAA